MKAHLAYVVSVLTAMVLTGSAAAGIIVPFNVGGLGFSASGTFVVEPNISPADPNPVCGTAGENPCRADPVGAWRIVAINGTFNDARIGLFDASITGLIPISPTNEHDPVFDPLVPTSLSYLSSGLSYNNLFFPDGSPIDCAYPFFGTYLDVFGIAFAIDGGMSVNIWGDGNEGPGGALTYGVAVGNSAAPLDYQFDGVSMGVPEPVGLAVFGYALLGLVLLRRRRAVKFPAG
jgi:hypothetical protein